MLASKLRRHARESRELRNAMLQVVDPEDDVIETDRAGPHHLRESDGRAHRQ
jgi:hypothetical protein